MARAAVPLGTGASGRAVARGAGKRGGASGVNRSRSSSVNFEGYRLVFLATSAIRPRCFAVRIRSLTYCAKKPVIPRPSIFQKNSKRRGRCTTAVIPAEIVERPACG